MYQYVSWPSSLCAGNNEKHFIKDKQRGSINLDSDMEPGVVVLMDSASVFKTSLMLLPSWKLKIVSSAIDIPDKKLVCSAYNLGYSRKTCLLS